MSLTLKECSSEQLTQLKELSYLTYTDTFGPFNSEENMQAYLTSAYNDEKLLTELAAADSIFYFLYQEETLVGYIKLNWNDAQTESITENALEIERLYVHPQHKRKGFGRFLMEQSLAIAAAKGKAHVWLGVWEHNEPAKAFYKEMGFRRQGQHIFVMGDDEQIDYIMVKDLSSI
jgi:Acetyltransferases